MAKGAIKAMPLRILNANTLDAPNFTIVPGGVTAFPLLILRVSNSSDQDVILSFDGVNEVDLIRSESDLLLNFQANAQPNGYVAQIAAGVHFYLAGIAGTGFIYISGYYQIT